MCTCTDRITYSVLEKAEYNRILKKNILTKYYIVQKKKKCKYQY